MPPGWAADPVAAGGSAASGGAAGLRLELGGSLRSAYDWDEAEAQGMIGSIASGVVAAIHLYILVLEMFLWDKPQGRRVFGTTEAFARESRVLAANQGLYNGFLAAGLVWGIWLGEAGDPVKIFFLLCVAVAGIYGAATVSPRIALVQTLPAAIALAAVWFA